MVTYFESPIIVKTATAPLNRSVSGYGSKLPTSYMIIDGRYKRRIYAICWSNAASYYVIIKGQQVFIRDCDFN